MKKMAILCTALLVGCDQGGMLNTPTFKADSVNRLSSKSFDARVYEFTPRTAEHITCVYIASNSNTSIDCFEKFFIPMEPMTEEKAEPGIDL